MSSSRLKEYACHSFSCATLRKAPAMVIVACCSLGTTRYRSLGSGSKSVTSARKPSRARSVATLLMRAAGNLVIRSMDPKEGEIVLTAVPGVQEVYETLRSTAIDERERHRVRLLEGIE